MLLHGIFLRRDSPRNTYNPHFIYNRQALRIYINYCYHSQYAKLEPYDLNNVIDVYRVQSSTRWVMWSFANRGVAT